MKLICTVEAVSEEERVASGRTQKDMVLAGYHLMEVCGIWVPATIYSMFRQGMLEVHTGYPRRHPEDCLHRSRTTSAATGKVVCDDCGVTVWSPPG